MNRIRFLLALFVLGIMLGCSPRPPLPPLLPIENVCTIQDQPYFFLPGRDETRHRLDIYLPTVGKDWPTALILHGGAWIVNDKSVIGNLGQALAHQGVAAVCINYRLFPSAQHPAQVTDLVRALRWTKTHLPAYGANTDDMFLIGYSAVALLVALAALDPKYLKTHGMHSKDLRGVAVVSGVYDVEVIPPPLRLVFTNRPEVWTEASPIWHVRADAPPFLVLYGERDIVLSERKSVKKQSYLFVEALKKASASVSIYEVPHSNHDQVMEQVGRQADSPTLRRLLDFISANRSP